MRLVRAPQRSRDAACAWLGHPSGRAEQPAQHWHADDDGGERRVERLVRVRVRVKVRVRVRVRVRARVRGRVRVRVRVRVRAPR